MGGVSRETVLEPMDGNRYEPKGIRPWGFTLTELMIVLGILAIVSGIGYPLLQRTWINGNLRSAAREMVGDFNQQKQRAMAGDTAAAGTRVHRVSVNLGTNSYILQRCTGTEIPCNGWETVQTKSLVSFGSGIFFDPGSAQTTIFEFQPRGVVSFQNENQVEGAVVLRNNRGSTATIIANLSGRTFVDFHMQ